MNSPGRQPGPAHSHLIWRVAAPSLAASVALLAIAWLAAVSLIEAQNEAERAVQDAREAIQASTELEKQLQEVRLRLTEYGATGDDAALSYLSDLKNQQFVLRFPAAAFQGPEGQQFAREMSRIFRGIEPDLNSLLAAASAERRREIAERLVNDILDPELLTRVRAQRALIDGALLSARDRIRKLTAWTVWMVVLLGLAGAGAGALAGFALARSLRRRLIELSVPIRTAAGTLDAVVGPVHVRGAGDVEDLELSLKSLSDRVTDVVQRLQAAERESLRNDQLAALGQLAAGLAHELRNPLTAIRTLVEVARGSGPDGHLDGRDLEVVDEELSRLDATLQSFLDYARPPSLQRTTIDLRDVVHRTVQLATPRAERQSVRIDVALPDEPLPLSADAEQLRQVLLNLLLNSLDALGAGGRVTISASADRSAQQVLLTVVDTGPGIPESLRSTLFEPFVSSKPSGTGLGLTICRRIVDSHGGTISADNAPSGGAVFTIRLPSTHWQERTGAHGDDRRAHNAESQLLPAAWRSDDGLQSAEIT